MKYFIRIFSKRLFFQLMNQKNQVDTDVKLDTLQNKKLDMVMVNQRKKVDTGNMAQ